MVARCDAVLFAGYGFGDIHLNMAFERFRESWRRPVANIGLANDNAMTAGSVLLGDYNPTVNAALRIFGTDPRSMRWLGYGIPETVGKLKKAKQFEASCNPNTPLAFWYNGMLAACRDSGEVVRQLR